MGWHTACNIVWAMTSIAGNTLKSGLFSPPVAGQTQETRDSRALLARSIEGITRRIGDPVTKPASDNPGVKELDVQVKNWLAQTFFGTLLKQMRDSPFKSEIFSGGRGGEAFGALYDTQLAGRMAQRIGDRIARPMVKKLEQKATEAYEKAQFKQRQLGDVYDSTNR